MPINKVGAPAAALALNLAEVLQLAMELIESSIHDQGQPRSDLLVCLI